MRVPPAARRPGGSRSAPPRARRRSVGSRRPRPCGRRGGGSPRPHPPGPALVPDSSVLQNLFPKVIERDRGNAGPLRCLAATLKRTDHGISLSRSERGIGTAPRGIRVRSTYDPSAFRRRCLPHLRRTRPASAFASPGHRPRRRAPGRQRAPGGRALPPAIRHPGGSHAPAPGARRARRPGRPRRAGGGPRRGGPAAQRGGPGLRGGAGPARVSHLAPYRGRCPGAAGRGAPPRRHPRARARRGARAAG